jgi:hypothetical protein
VNTGSCVVRLALAVTIAHVSIATADPRTALSDARAQWRDAEYDAAATSAERTTTDSSATPSERCEAFVLMGSRTALRDDAPGAMLVYKQCFPLDPEFQPPDYVEPKFRELFAAARASWQIEQERVLLRRLGPQLDQIKIEVTAPRSPRGGTTIPLTFDVRDPSRAGVDLLIGYRRRGETSYVTKPFRLDAPRVSLQLPAEWTESRRRYEVEYFAWLRHGSGVVLARAGRTAAPLSLSIAPGTRPKPWWYPRWYTVAAAGVIVAGITTLALYARDVGPEELVFR